MHSRCVKLFLFLFGNFVHTLNELLINESDTLDRTGIRRFSIDWRKKKIRSFPTEELSNFSFFNFINSWCDKFSRSNNTGWSSLFKLAKNSIELGTTKVWYHLRCISVNSIWPNSVWFLSWDCCSVGWSLWVQDLHLINSCISIHSGGEINFNFLMWMRFSFWKINVLCKWMTNNLWFVTETTRILHSFGVPYRFTSNWIKIMQTINRTNITHYITPKFGARNEEQLSNEKK